jgi:hypothetical protein
MGCREFHGVFLLSLIELRAHRFDAPPRHPIGLAVPRQNETPFLQAHKHVECAVRQDMPIACETGDCAYLAAVAPFVVDGPTKGEFVQNTLFVL